MGGENMTDLSDVKYVVWKDGKPIGSNSPEETKRISKRLQIIKKVMKEMSLEGDYSKVVTKLAQEDFDKFMKLRDRVQELAKKAGC